MGPPFAWAAASIALPFERGGRPSRGLGCWGACGAPATTPLFRCASDLLGDFATCCLNMSSSAPRCESVGGRGFAADISAAGGCPPIGIAAPGAICPYGWEKEAGPAFDQPLGCCGWPCRRRGRLAAWAGAATFFASPVSCAVSLEGVEQ